MDSCNQARGRFALAVRATLLLAVLAFLPAGVARADLISIDFNAVGGATQSGAAVIGAAGDQWNGINPSTTPGPHALNTTTGAASGVSLTIVNMGQILFNAPPPPFTSTPYASLMQDGCLIGSPSPPASMTFSGLVANQAYELYFYAQGVAGVASSTTFTINGTPKTVNSDGTTNTFIEGTTYGHFASVLASGAGTLTISITGGGNWPGLLNGLQLSSQVPAPGAMAAIAAFAVVGGARRRRRSS